MMEKKRFRCKFKLNSTQLMEVSKWGIHFYTEVPQFLIVSLIFERIKLSGLQTHFFSNMLADPHLLSSPRVPSSSRLTQLSVPLRVTMLHPGWMPCLPQTVSH